MTRETRQRASQAGSQRRRLTADKEKHVSRDSDDESDQEAAPSGSVTAPPRPVSENFQKAHRLFLHCWLSTKFGTHDDALSLFKYCCDKHDLEYDKAAFDDFVSVINESLFPIDMKLSSALSMETGRRHWALINLNSDDASQLATTFSVTELAFVKRVVALIVSAENFQFQQSKAALTKKNAEDIVDKLIQEKSGMLSLSLRSQMELKEYIRNEFDDNVYSCTLCKDTILSKFEKCTNSECDGRLHTKCPESDCGQAWESSGAGRPSRSAPTAAPTV
ncbi:Nse1 non-SMC component of SMC5-6 complex-domain-containing protein [Chytridium lagenaria]|nr:Nse1 non-SMC component of SMC5-6 complex-domain-containing protein [Chytridium lagenaria]